MLRLLSVAVLLLPAAASALDAKANGYVSARNEGTLEGDSALASALRLPGYRLLGEANGQLRVAWSDRYDLYTDLSVFLSKSSGEKTSPAYAAMNQNQLVFSELYANLGFTDSLRGLVGKKRIVWGSGFLNNPSDLLNPPRDPTDPTFQRAGAWLAMVEYTRPSWAATLLAVPEVFRTEAGLPRSVLTEGLSPHVALAARYYRLLFDSDLNLVYFLTNRFYDALPWRSQAAVSFSRYFFTDYELHVEALARQGSTTRVFNPACLGDVFALARCVSNREPLTDAPEARKSVVRGRGLVGGRTMFKDESLLSVEYLFNGEGLTARQFADRTAFLNLIGVLPPEAVGGFFGGGGESGALPARFSFEPARRHYAFVYYSKPRIKDDFTVGATGIFGLEDLSGLVGPSFAWSAREWLSLSLFGFVPFGKSDSEFGMTPFKGRLTGELRVFW